MIQSPCVPKFGTSICTNWFEKDRSVEKLPTKRSGAIATQRPDEISQRSSAPVYLKSLSEHGNMKDLEKDDSERLGGPKKSPSQITSTESHAWRPKRAKGRETTPRETVCPPSVRAQDQALKKLRNSTCTEKHKRNPRGPPQHSNVGRPSSDA